MRKYEPVDLDDNEALRSRLEIPSAVTLAASLGWGVELRQGVCAGPRCRAHTDLTFLGLCPACTKAAFDGQFVKTDDGRWRRADIPAMRGVTQAVRRIIEDELTQVYRWVGCRECQNDATSVCDGCVVHKRVTHFSPKWKAVAS